MPDALEVQETYASSPEKVWQALTRPEQMKHWYFNIPVFHAEPGFQFEFIAGDREDRQWVHKCRIVTVVPQKELSYSWAYEGLPGSSVVTFKLEPVNEGCSLKVMHEGLDTFPQDNDSFSIESFRDGWNYILTESLKGYLEPALHVE